MLSASTSITKLPFGLSSRLPPSSTSHLPPTSRMPIIRTYATKDCISHWLRNKYHEVTTQPIIKSVKAKGNVAKLLEDINNEHHKYIDYHKWHARSIDPNYEEDCRQHFIAMVEFAYKLSQIEEDRPQVDDSIHSLMCFIKYLPIEHRTRLMADLNGGQREDLLAWFLKRNEQYGN